MYVSVTTLLLRRKGCLKRKLFTSLVDVKCVTVFLLPKFPKFKFKGNTMKRLVTLAACLAMLGFTGCAGGTFSGGLFNSGCNSGCNSSPGLLSDGPLRQFFRGDACDSCNSAAGQLSPTFSGSAAPSCDTCNGIPSGVSTGGFVSDPYAIPADSFPTAQPATSFYTPDGGVPVGQPAIQDSGVTPIDPGSIYGSGDIFNGAIDGGLSEPPVGSSSR